MVNKSKQPKKSKFLSLEEDQELGRKVQAGLKADKRLKEIEDGAELKYDGEIEDLKKLSKERMRAREIFFENNEGLVTKIAANHKKKFPTTLDLEDLKHDGIFGLYVAIDKYDPSRGYKFSTMAYNWISTHISRAANKSARMVRLPENRVTDYSKMNAIAIRENRPLDSTLIKDIITGELNIPFEDAMAVLMAASYPASLDYKYDGPDANDKGHTMGQLIPHNNGEDHPANQTINKEMFLKYVDGPLSNLGPEAKDVLYSHFEISGITPKEVRGKYRLSNKRYNDVLEKTLNLLSMNALEDSTE